MSQMESIVVIGGGAAGVAAAESLRRDGYSGSLILLGDEPALPSDRPRCPSRSSPARGGTSGPAA